MSNLILKNDFVTHQNPSKHLIMRIRSHFLFAFFSFLGYDNGNSKLVSHSVSNVFSFAACHFFEEEPAKT